MRLARPLRALIQTPRLREALLVGLVAVVSLAASFLAMRVARDRGVVPFFYQRYYEAAVRVACGQPFGTDQDGKLSKEMSAFLSLERGTLSCEAVPRALHPNPNPPTRTWYHLFVTVAAVWRVTGISWAAIDGIAAVMMSISAVCVYAIFRLWIPAVLAVPLAVISILPGLRYLLYLRDLGKAPFILASLLVVAWLASRDLTRSRFFTVMIGIGLLLGVGYGFRPDVVIGLPLIAATATLFRPAPLRRIWLGGVLGSLLMAAAFVLAARPVFSAFSSNVGGCHWHFSLLGLSDESTRQLALPRGNVSWLPHPDDLIAWRSVESYAERVLASPAVGYCTPAYDRVSKAMYIETITTFPGDFLTRALAAGEGTIAYGFWGLSPARGLDAASLGVWIRHSLQAGSTLLWVVVILTLLARDVRLGLFACFTLTYLCAYPIVQFHPRHLFHLAFLAWVPVGLVLTFLVGQRRRILDAAKASDWRSGFGGLELPAAADWIRALVILVGLVALAAAVLFAARWYQRGRVAELFARYLAARGEAAPLADAVENDRTWRVTYAKVVPEEGREVTGRMLRVEVGGPGCPAGDHALTLALNGPDPGYGFRQEFKLTLLPERPATSLFAPLYFERQRLDRVSIELSRNDKPCLIGAKWLDSAALPPLWVGATIDEGD